VIKIESLEKRFADVCAVDNLSIELHDGQITGLLGPNGAGKTSTLRMMYGLVRPSGGGIYVDGISVVDEPQKVQAQMGVLPDDGGVYERLSARENIEYFGRLQGLNESQLKTHTDELIELLDMHSIEHRRTAGFSLGERTKVALARAIVHQPQRILLDEPTNGLDVMTTRAVRRLLLELRDRGRCIVFTSHLMHEVENLCDRVVIVAKGRIIADGSVAEIIKQSGTESMEEAFVSLACEPERRAMVETSKESTHV